MIAVPSYGEQGSWVVKSGNPGEVKVCRISKQLDDGVIMSEYFKPISRFGNHFRKCSFPNNERKR